VWWLRVTLPFKVVSSSQGKQGGIQRLTRSPPDYNWATRPVLLRICQRVIVKEDVLVILPFLTRVQLWYQMMCPVQVGLDGKPIQIYARPAPPTKLAPATKITMHRSSYNATRASCCASAILASHSGAPLEERPNRLKRLVWWWRVALPFKVVSSSQAKQDGIMRLTRSSSDYNLAILPILLCLCQRVIEEEDVLIMTQITIPNKRLKIVQRNYLFRPWKKIARCLHAIASL
jgi:hypothetical protein